MEIITGVMLVRVQENTVFQSGVEGCGEWANDSEASTSPDQESITLLRSQILHSTGESLMRLAHEANIELRKDMKPEEITFEVVMDLLRRQYSYVLWRLSPKKSALGKQPREYDHHTLMLIKRLFY